MEQQPIRPIGTDDILLWPDGFWCFYGDACRVVGKGDNYEVIQAYSMRWSLIIEA